MKLSSVREGLPFGLATRQESPRRGANTTTSPDPSNSMCKPTTEQQRHSMNFVQTIPSQSSIQYLPAEATLRQHRISLVTKYARSEPNSPSTSSERTFRDATTGQTRYMIPSVGLLKKPMPDSLTISGHSWSPVMGGYPLAYANDYAVVRLIHARNVAKSRLFLILPLRVQSTVALPVCNTPARAPQRDQNRTRPSLHNHKVSRAGLLLATRMILKAVSQIWFQVLQGYIPEDGPHKKPSIEAEGEKARRTIQASNGRKNLLSSDARQHPLERSVKWHMPLTKTARQLQRSLTTSGSTPSSNSCTR
jgi:hypothetical protein